MSYRNPVRAVTATIAGSGTSSVRVRGTTTNTASNVATSSTTAYPSSLVAGDLLMLVVAHATNFAPTVQDSNAWTQVLQRVGSSPGLAIFTRPATSADVGASVTVSFGSGCQHSITLMALAGATTLTVQSQAATATNGTTSLPSGTVSSGAFLIAALSSGGTSGLGATAIGWGSAVQGGPPNPSTWTTQGVSNGNGAQQMVGVAVANWTPADSYNASLTTPAGGGQAAMLLAA